MLKQSSNNDEMLMSKISKLLGTLKPYQHKIVKTGLSILMAAALMIFSKYIYIHIVLVVLLSCTVNRHRVRTRHTWGTRFLIGS